MIEIREFLDRNGKSPFKKWFNRLKPQAAAKVAVALIRLENGNTSSLKNMGGGIHEIKIDWGPGYRVYLGREEEQLVILFGGGTKKNQRNDIKRAKERWSIYKRQNRS